MSTTMAFLLIFVLIFSADSSSVSSGAPATEVENISPAGGLKRSVTDTFTGISPLTSYAELKESTAPHSTSLERKKRSSLHLSLNKSRKLQKTPAERDCEWACFGMRNAEMFRQPYEESDSCEWICLSNLYKSMVPIPMQFQPPYPAPVQPQMGQQMFPLPGLPPISDLNTPVHPPFELPSSLMNEPSFPFPNLPIAPPIFGEQPQPRPYLNLNQPNGGPPPMQQRNHPTNPFIHPPLPYFIPAPINEMASIIGELYFPIYSPKGSVNTLKRECHCHCIPPIGLLEGWVDCDCHCPPYNGEFVEEGVSDSNGDGVSNDTSNDDEDNTESDDDSDDEESKDEVKASEESKEETDESEENEDDADSAE